MLYSIVELEVLNPQKQFSHSINLLILPKSGGERGIRTLGGVAPTPDFESGTFVHSVISPIELIQNHFQKTFKENVVKMDFLKFFIIMLAVIC